jgi:hypothetical protein
MQKFKIILLGMIMVCVFVAQVEIAVAQTSRGTVTGTVHDPGGAVVSRSNGHADEGRYRRQSRNDQQRRG